MSHDAREAMTAIALRMKNYYSDAAPGPWAMHHPAEYAVTTDGHVLVIVARDRIEGELPEIPEKVAKLAQEWALRPFTQPVEYRADDLMAFAGRLSPPVNCETCHNERSIECDECEGSGSVDCECMGCGDLHQAQCDKCRGDGDRKCPDCSADGEDLPATLCGALVNRRRLFDVFAVVQLVGGSAVTLSREPHSGQHLLAMAGDGWRALVMEMAPHVKPAAHFDQPETWKSEKQPAL